MQLHPLSCVRQQRYSPLFLHDSTVMTGTAAALTHIKACARTHVHTPRRTRQGQRVGHRFRLDTVDHWLVKCLHFKLTQMAMVYKVCGQGGGVGGDGLGIVINLCLVWNKEISSHTNRRRLLVTPL